MMCSQDSRSIRSVGGVSGFPSVKSFGSSRRLVFRPDIDVNQSFGVTIEMMLELIQLRRNRNPNEASPVLLHVLKEGVGILTMNLGFKWRIGHRWHKLRRATR